MSDKPKDLVVWFYATLREKKYKPLEYWGRDCKHAKKFLDSGRTFEDFKKLVLKALVGPKQVQIAVCSGVHTFMSFLGTIERLDEKPWEPSAEERAANVKLINAAAEALILGGRSEPKWVKNPNGGWMRNPRSWQE